MKYIRSYQYLTHTHTHTHTHIYIYIYIIKILAEFSLYSFDIKLSTQYFSTYKH
jgi:hypothetical protein